MLWVEVDPTSSLNIGPEADKPEHNHIQICVNRVQFVAVRAGHQQEAHVGAVGRDQWLPGPGGDCPPVRLAGT